jgi:hypothetical protein
VPGSYSTLNSATASNAPPSRDSHVEWIDSSGDVMIFGGTDVIELGGISKLNDSWKFAPGR